MLIVFDLFVSGKSSDLFHHCSSSQSSKVVSCLFLLHHCVKHVESHNVCDCEAIFYDCGLTGTTMTSGQQYIAASANTAG
jgi:hypothetical protein